MANENLPTAQGTSTAVALFQKAHGRMTTMQRIDEQIVALVEQRRKLQDELRAVQTLINEEFDRVTSNRPDLPNRMIVHSDTSQDEDRTHQELHEVAA